MWKYYFVKAYPFDSWDAKNDHIDHNSEAILLSGNIGSDADDVGVFLSAMKGFIVGQWDSSQVALIAQCASFWRAAYWTELYDIY